MKIASLLAATLLFSASAANATYYISDFDGSTGANYRDQITVNFNESEGYRDGDSHFVMFSAAPMIKSASLFLSSSDASGYSLISGYNPPLPSYDNTYITTNTVDSTSYGLVNGVKLSVTSFGFSDEFTQNYYRDPVVETLDIFYTLSNGSSYYIEAHANTDDIPMPPPIAAVPETTTWGMMLIGFGAAGYALRCRRKPTSRHAAVSA